MIHGQNNLSLFSRPASLSTAIPHPENIYDGLLFFPHPFFVLNVETRARFDHSIVMEIYGAYYHINLGR